MIDEIQLANLFLDLVRLDSPSRGERQAGDAIIDWLGRLGLTVQEDLAGEAIGGNCGNLLCTIAANWACDGGGAPASRTVQLPRTNKPSVMTQASNVPIGRRSCSPPIWIRSDPAPAKKSRLALTGSFEVTAQPSSARIIMPALLLC